MKVALNYVDSFRGLRALAASGFSNQNALKAMREKVWEHLRATYGLDNNLKFKISLDGASAGELRLKGTSEPYDSGAAEEDYTVYVYRDPCTKQITASLSEPRGVNAYDSYEGCL